uniref:Ionotropic glutamate receptor C-terminal domain-containing protein n=1 Tax=Glossina brevipalpis TaxID=37001 RepID=A0A1A9X076_9MUSC
MNCLVFITLFSIFKRIETFSIQMEDDSGTEVSIALSQIIKSLKPTQLAILSKPRLPLNSSIEEQEEMDDGFYNDNIEKNVDDFIHQLHKLYFKSVIFYDVELFFQYIESSLIGSIESTNLVFFKPQDLIDRIYERKLAHRLSLFIFYWGAKYPPKRREIKFLEPLRAVIITRPRSRAFRIYYNQAVSTNNGQLSLVSWYDGENLGLSKEPLLPLASSVYADFHKRVFRVPVFHSPPWFWVNYENDTYDKATQLEYDNEESYKDEEGSEFQEVQVIGGRDHRLLQLLATHMNFEFVYIEAPGRTQGSLHTDNEDNETFTGGIGLLQSGLADFFLGDVSLSWERRKVIEFSFFTLADSGAFATHAPRRLNEALAILRPFKPDVWPYLILTIMFSSPIFYFIIATPFKWQSKNNINKQPEFHMVYIREITHIEGRIERQQQQQEIHREETEIPKNLFDKCFWFTVQLFLKQSCKELSSGYRAKFLTIVYWIAGTYVLADVYSAQLTSLFARPVREPPINTLAKLQKAMLEDGYQLFVEKESSSLEMLENGTEIFRQLYALMKSQNHLEDGYLIESVEAGIHLIADGHGNKAILGGRETLYFNIKRYGSKNFQLSQKLYTRYSAVAVQIGCPFLDSLNDVLMHLFEGGILDKMTTAEYETQSRFLNKDKIYKTTPQVVVDNDDLDNVEDLSNNKGQTTKSSEANEMKKPQDAPTIIQPLNLRMLQGAFIILMVGYFLAASVLLIEIFTHDLSCDIRKTCKKYVNKKLKWFKNKLLVIATNFIQEITPRNS